MRRGKGGRDSASEKTRRQTHKKTDRHTHKKTDTERERQSGHRKDRQGTARPGTPLTLKKTHKLKADATTFTWHPGPHQITLQVNGVDQATAVFKVV